MMLRRAAASLLVVFGGVLGGVVAAPAQADTASSVDSFLNAIDGLGIKDLDPANALEIGRSVCPLLAERGQNTADIAGKVSDAIGKPLGPSMMFTGAAISLLCPKAIENVTNSLSAGKLPLPLFGG